MDPELLFQWAGRAALAGWLLLVLLPRWSARLVCGALIPALLAALYAYLIAAHWGEREGGFGSLAQVAALFEHRHLLLAGWVHYLAFDLFVGAWEVRDARRLRIHHLAVVPCLVLTFLLGPIGLLAYLALRAAWRRRFGVDEGAGGARAVA